MVSITANTTHGVKKKKVVPKKGGGGLLPKKGGAARRGSIAPPLKPVTCLGPGLAALRAKSKDEQKVAVQDLFAKALGEESVVLNMAAPHAASTTRDRAGAAADVAVAAKELGVVFVLKECGVLDTLQRMLFPGGIDGFFNKQQQQTEEEATGGLKPSLSALSLSSLVMAGDADTASMGTTTVNSVGTDTKRGKTTPPNAREGSLLVIRALCEITGRAAEPFVVGAFLAAALDECASSSSAIRQAAEDTTAALVALAHPWAFPCIVGPLLLQSLQSSGEWRVKAAALERLQQAAATCPVQVHKNVPKLIPPITNQVWDTKAQVSKAARSALLAICQTNTNPDIQNAIVAVCDAICKPSECNKAVSELMGTTFVVPVDAPTLAILCPVLARALKEKLAIHKRAACLVVANMSKLVVSPEAVAPFGNLLVPELQKVANNVQFEEIRDEALKALAALTKALGDSYSAEGSSREQQQQQDLMESEQARVTAEQEKIEQEREEAKKKEEEFRAKEEEERKKFKDAMDAQRELDILAAKEAQQKREEEEKKREEQRRSTKGASGKCQMCGLKKCKKSCMFFGK